MAVQNGILIPCTLLVGDREIDLELEVFAHKAGGHLAIEAIRLNDEVIYFDQEQYEDIADVVGELFPFG